MAECWNIDKETQSKLEAAEMWFYRRILRISYLDRITNVIVIERVRRRRQLLEIIERRQQQFLEHIIRKGELGDLSLSGKIAGKEPEADQEQPFCKTTLMQEANPTTSAKKKTRN